MPNRKRISREPLSLFPETGRLCSKCHTTKPRSEFARQKRNKDGLRSQCKACTAGRGQSETFAKWYEANRQKVIETAQRWRAANLDKARASARKYQQANRSKLRELSLKKYGLTTEEFEAKLTDQKHKCTTCKTELRTGHHTHIDHCHTTGQTRGILCAQCNHALGLAKDNPTLLRAMADYIEHWQREHAALKLSEANTPTQEQPWPEAKDDQASDAT